jgi:hypothetical protein
MKQQLHHHQESTLTSQLSLSASRVAISCLLGVLTLTASTLAGGAQTASTKSSAVPNFEGIWLPQDFIGGAPGPGLPGGPPAVEGGGPGGAGGPPPGGPGGPGGPNGPGGGAPANQDQVVNCAPLQRLDGGGGGDSDLIVQSPTEIVLLAEEYMDVARKIYLNAKHPAKVKPQPNGHSIGHFEGNALIVDTIGYADKDGNDAGQHVVERWTRDGDKITSEATVIDKSGRTSKRNFTWVKEQGLQFNESVCEEAFDRFQYVNGKLVETNTAEGL